MNTPKRKPILRRSQNKMLMTWRLFPRPLVFKTNPWSKCIFNLLFSCYWQFSQKGFLMNIRKVLRTYIYWRQGWAIAKIISFTFYLTFTIFWFVYYLLLPKHKTMFENISLFQNVEIQCNKFLTIFCQKNKA